MTQTLVSLWADARKRLEAAGVDTPVLDARLLLEAGAGVARLDLVTDPRRAVSDLQVAAVDALVRRREAREPLSHILGKKAFWSFDLVVTPDVLTPRPETELLVEIALRALPADRPARILDLGVGSGAILLAVLWERPLAHGVGVDASTAALAVTQKNAELLGLERRIELRHGRWADGLGGAFDLVVSNPPYIPSDDIEGLAPEVARFEPRLALDGGADGLDAYRAIAPTLPRLLVRGGVFALEIGAGQAEAVLAVLQREGLSAVDALPDLGGRPRVVTGRRDGDAEKALGTGHAKH
ncbi:MAG: peptide chain release factor N(5)-glutamine methyltransferase [Hyphomonadaceae bacterium]|nr:peptide chain release factor N(5)-glutamine methyltransferase [Hyphomonadaceae bacterium]